MRVIRSGALVLVLLLYGVSHAQSGESKTPTIQSVTARYGKPDKVISNEFERPRVRTVSRALLYKKQAVKFVFVPDAPDSAPPPYKRWKFAAVRDAKSDAALPVDEAEARMKPRLLAPRTKASSSSGTQPPATGRWSRGAKRPESTTALRGQPPVTLFKPAPRTPTTLGKALRFAG